MYVQPKSNPQSAALGVLLEHMCVYVLPKSNPQSAAAAPFIGATRPYTCREDNIRVVFLHHRVPLYTQVPMPLLLPYSVCLRPISVFLSVNLADITPGTAAACYPEVFTPP